MIQNWSIHNSSGHCRHVSGLDAYVDFAQRNTLEIPLLGPFGPGPILEDVVISLIRTLEHKYPNKYVVMGELAKEPNESVHKINALGSCLPWHAMHSARTLLLTKHNSNQEEVSREWSLEDNGELIHKSGISFLQTRAGLITASVSEFSSDPNLMVAARAAYSILSPDSRELPFAATL